MKILLFFFIFGICLKLQSQSNIEEKVFFDVINQVSYSDKKTKTGYLKKIDLGILNQHIENFKKQKNLVYSMYQRKSQKVDTITITLTEKKYLLSSLKKFKDFEWNLNNNTDLIVVEQNSVLKFLAEDRDRELKMVSKPIFIRDKSIACVLSVHLCCGSINGHDSLSFYKLIDKQWVEWIVISGGAW